MRLGWLLPDASGQVLTDGWSRAAYRPRHGKPPLTVRTAWGAAMAIGKARDRYLGGSVEDRDLLAADPARARRIDMSKLRLT
jgi:hypothetical protein